MISRINGVNCNVRYNQVKTKRAQNNNNYAHNNYTSNNITFGAAPKVNSNVAGWIIGMLSIFGVMIFSLSSDVKEDQALANDRDTEQFILRTPKFVVAKKGDTVYGIAQANNISLEDMVEYNPHLLKQYSDGPATGNSWKDFKTLQLNDTVYTNDLKCARLDHIYTHYNAQDDEYSTTTSSQDYCTPGEIIYEITDADGKHVRYLGNGKEGDPNGNIYGPTYTWDGKGNPITD